MGLMVPASAAADTHRLHKLTLLTKPVQVTNDTVEMADDQVADDHAASYTRSAISSDGFVGIDL